MIYTLIAALFCSMILFFFSFLLRCCSLKLAAGFVLLFSLPPFLLAIYLGSLLMLGAPKPLRLNLGDSASYSREVVNGKAVAHVLRLDRKAYRLILSGNQKGGAAGKLSALKTSNALLAKDALFAINACFFTPFKDRHVFDYYPAEGDSVQTIGYSYDGQTRSGLKARRWPKLLAMKDGELVITPAGDDELIIDKPNMQFALSGRSILLKANTNIVSVDSEHADTVKAYPRTALGIDSTGEFLWLVVIDGKQPRYSDGLSLAALADFMLSLGVSDAIELDGGGSATMVWKNVDGKAEVLNRPIHTKIPYRERPVANHLLVVKDV